MKTLVAVMSITFLISCGGGDVRHHYAQVSGPSPAGHVFLVINSECAYTIKLELAYPFDSGCGIIKA